MRRFSLLLLLATMLTACTQSEIEVQPNKPFEAPETLTISFEDPADTRIQLNEAGKTVWNEDDLVSVFYRSNANQKWQNQGATGERVAELKRVNAGSATETMNRVVVVYPYNDNYYINTDTYNVQASLPAEQTYLKDSYGHDGNIMISQGEYNQFSLKNVCGWLKLQLTGNGEKIATITLRGNNDEQVAGELYINSADATAILASESGTAGDDSEVGGSLIFDDSIITEVTLNCGEGVELGAEATSFFIALPPQTFANGLTIIAYTDEGKMMTKSTDKEVVISRNAIQPMGTFEAAFAVPNNQIWYTSSDGAVVTPEAKADFGAPILSNTYEDGKGIITFDGDVTSIGSSAFYFNSNITSIAMPDSVTKIGDAAFYLCSSLTSAYIPEGVTAFGDQAFYYCAQLESITIPESVETIGYDTFNNCKALSEFNGKFASADGRCLIIDGALHSFAPAGITEYAIPEGITAIRQHAFYECTRLTSVTIPEGVTSIGEMVFYGCSSLTGTLTIPDSVTEIGTRAFFGCKGLTEFKSKFASADGRCLVIDGSLHSFAPAGITEYAIPEGVTTIAPYTFYNCSNLTNITIPNGTTTLGDRSFYNCSSLTSITLVESITQIGDYVFNGCSSLASVYCKATNPPTAVFRFGWSAFEKNASDRKIYVPTTAVEDYKAANGWSKYADYIEGYDF